MADPIGSIMIGSDDVEAMKDWYRKAFGVEENEMGAFVFGGVGLFIEEHSEVSGKAADPARIIINLDVADCRAAEKMVEAAGANWIRKVEHQPYGLIGTVADPDGNYVQIIQWGAEPESHKA